MIRPAAKRSRPSVNYSAPKRPCLIQVCGSKSRGAVRRAGRSGGELVNAINTCRVSAGHFAPFHVLSRTRASIFPQLRAIPADGFDSRQLHRKEAALSRALSFLAGQTSTGRQRRRLRCQTTLGSSQRQQSSNGARSRRYDHRSTNASRQPSARSWRQARNDISSRLLRNPR